MKVKTLLVFLIIICSFTCKKNSTTAPFDIDYSKYHVDQYIKHIVTTNSDYFDTTTFSYKNKNITTTTRYSNSNEIYTSKYIKDGDRFIYQRYDDNVQFLDGFYSLNNSGYLDSSNIVRMDGSTNNTAKWKYSSGGQQIQSLSYYSGYTNDYKKYYSDRDYAYWIYDFDRYVNPITVNKDSIVFEYYNSMPMYVLYGWALESYTGEPNDHLVKKRTYYNLKNNSTVHQTYEYEYKLDDNGLVTQEIWRIIEQPSGIVTRTNTTNYTYIKM